MALRRPPIVAGDVRRHPPGAHRPHEVPRVVGPVHPQRGPAVHAARQHRQGGLALAVAVRLAQLDVHHQPVPGVHRLEPRRLPRQGGVDQRLDAPQGVVRRDERLRRQRQQDLGLSCGLSAHVVPPIGTPMIPGQLFFSTLLGLYGSALRRAVGRRPTVTRHFLRNGTQHTAAWDSVDAALIEARARVDAGGTLEPAPPDCVADGPSELV